MLNFFSCTSLARSLGSKQYFAVPPRVQWTLPKMQPSGAGLESTPLLYSDVIYHAKPFFKLSLKMWFISSHSDVIYHSTPIFKLSLKMWFSLDYSDVIYHSTSFFELNLKMSCITKVLHQVFNMRLKVISVYDWVNLIWCDSVNSVNLIWYDSVNLIWFDWVNIPIIIIIIIIIWMYMLCLDIFHVLPIFSAGHMYRLFLNSSFHKVILFLYSLFPHYSSGQFMIRTTFLYFVANNIFIVSSGFVENN